MAPARFTLIRMKRLHRLVILAGVFIIPGCVPNSGSTTRDPDPDAPRGAGTVELNAPLGGSQRQPSDADVRDIQSGPTPPARGGE